MALQLAVRVAAILVVGYLLGGIPWGVFGVPDNYVGVYVQLFGMSISAFVLVQLLRGKARLY